MTCRLQRFVKLLSQFAVRRLAAIADKNSGRFGWFLSWGGWLRITNQGDRSPHSGMNDLLPARLQFPLHKAEQVITRDRFLHRMFGRQAFQERGGKNAMLFPFPSPFKVTAGGNQTRILFMAEDSLRGLQEAPLLFQQGTGIAAIHHHDQAAQLRLAHQLIQRVKGNRILPFSSGARCRQIAFLFSSQRIRNAKTMSREIENGLLTLGPLSKKRPQFFS